MVERLRLVLQLAWKMDNQLVGKMAVKMAVHLECIDHRPMDTSFSELGMCCSDSGYFFSLPRRMISFSRLARTSNFETSFIVFALTKVT